MVSRLFHIPERLKLCEQACVIKLFYSPKRLSFVAVSFAATANKRDIDACTRTGDLFGVDPFVC
jgi:hypothetical protein